jgi:two-component system cell cycle sensor histidine kinase/response regulator CckA
MTVAPRSLRGQLLAAFLAVALLPAIALGGFVAWSALRAARRSALEHSGQLAAAVAAEIGRHLEAHLLYLRGVQVSVDAWREIGLTDLRLAQHAAPNPAIQALLLLDESGRVAEVVPPDLDLQGNDLSRLPYVAEARRRAEPTWSSATLSPRTGLPVVSLVVPGHPWTLVGYLDLTALRDIVARVRSQRHADVTVIDRDGTILAADAEQHVQERVNVGDVALVREALDGRSGTDEVAFLGTRQLASATPVPLTGWVVVASQPVDDAYALVSRIRGYFLAASALASLLAVAAAVLLSRRIQRPIEALAEAARMVAGGDYHLALPRGALRETDALAGSFDAMVAGIQERERARAEADRHYRNVVSTPLVAVARASVDGEVIFCNEAAARLVGLTSADAALGRNAGEMLAEPAEWERLQADLRQVQRIANRELTLRRFDGGRPEQVLANAMAAEDGVTLVMLDVTEERRVSAERERLEVQLLHSQKLEAVGRLAGGVAHDFNNMLTVIVGFGAELCETLPPETPAREAADAILQAAKRASVLTQSLLAYSRKQVLKPRSIDLRETVRDAAQLVGRIIGEDVELAVVVPDASVPMVADPGQLEQVLMNLCTNARDAMPLGGRLTLAMTVETISDEHAREWGLRRGGRYAQIEVRDTGQGMTAEVRARIFEPFFTTKERGKGTGLGLAIAYGIVRQHEGHVQVRSTPGAGTTVTLFLPMRDGLPDTEPAPVAAPPLAGLARRETVLLAEDEVLVRRVMRSILERAGYQVLKAADGAEALELFAAHRDAISLCVFDVVMPRLNGREASERVRQLCPRMPVLLVSGYAADVLDSAGPGEDVPELLGKPVIPREFLAKVRELIDRAAAAAKRHTALVL